MRIVEVGPRDGLQNETKTLSLVEKEELILSLLECGFQNIEVGSFVKKDAIPQLQQTDELVRKILPVKNKRFPKATLWAFAPNEIGLQHADDAGVEGFSFFSATSEVFSKKNVNKSHKELKELLKSIARHIPKKKSRVYLSTLVYCPFEGTIAPKKVFQWVDFLLEQGFGDISLSDTTGHAHPKNLRPILEKLAKSYDLKKFSLHFHDTRSTALLNTFYAYDLGFKSFDSSLGGAGGCPFAPGSAGNLATEDLLYLAQSSSQLKNVSLEKVAETSFKLEKWLGRTLPSKILQTLRKK